MIGLDAFHAYGRQGFTNVPLWRTLPISKAVTPEAVYRSLANKGDDYLFETRTRLGDRDPGFEKQLSIIGLRCAERLELDDDRLRVLRNGQVLHESFDADALSLLKQRLDGQRVPLLNGLPPFFGGFFGYFGFETTRMIEPRLRRLSRKPKPFDLPDIVQLVSEELIVFDHVAQQIFVIVHGRPDGRNRSLDVERFEAAISRIGELCFKLQSLDCGPEPTRHVNGRSPCKAMDHTFPRADFETGVLKIGDYIRAGDVMQVVLSQRTTRALAADATDYYLALTSLSPAPYSYLLNLGDSQIIGVSPEMLVQQRANRIVSRPMAGTRRRGTTDIEDRELETELLADPKELAEHMMLVDLARNDLGRLAEVGSVEVEAKLSVERYSHVMHLVSSVAARARADCDGLDTLRCTFPAGTLSGAPKVRALEIISEIEPFSRGVYGGAVGYLTWRGDADLAIAIRTAVLREGLLHIQAGAGVVFDSKPEREWQETIEKGSALFLAAELAETLSASHAGKRSLFEPMSALGATAGSDNSGRAAHASHDRQL